MDWLNKYMIIPFKDKGRSFEGCDCWGLVYLIYKNELGIELPLYVDGYESANSLEVEKLIEKNKNRWVPIKEQEVRAFDCVLCSSVLRVGNSAVRADSHVGLIIKKGLMLHITYGGNVSQSRYETDFTIRNRIRGFYRYEA